MSPSWAQSQTTTVETIQAPVDSYSVPVQRLDSWMAPTHVRTRELVNAAGDREIIQEPLVLERHERVLAPVSTMRTTMETQYGGHQVTTAQTATTASRRASVKPLRKASSKHFHKRRAVASRATASKSRIAWRTVSTPVVIERKEETEHRAVILVRKDPALLLY